MAMTVSQGPSDSSPSSSLNALIAQLMGAGGNYNKNQPARNADITAQQNTQAQYSKPAAFADAQAILNQVLAQQMAESMPSIVRGADGAGASAGSMRALLTQQAVENAAQTAAAQGAQLAVDYGNISNTSGNILEALTRGDATELQALLEALRLQQDGARSNGSGGANTSGAVQPAKQPQGVVGAGKENAQGWRSAGASGAASATFIPANQQPDTSSFFNRPATYGKGVSVGNDFNPYTTLDTIQRGLPPSQTVDGISLPSDYLTTGFRF